MPKIILLPVTGASSDADAFAAALSVAAAFDAHIVGLHVRPDIRRDISSLAASDGGMTAGIDTVLEKMEGDADAREKTATESWRTFCQQNKIPGVETPANNQSGITGEWASEVGVEADWVAEYGRAADLIVVGRGEPRWGPDFVLMEAALMDTGKPVLVAPRVSDKPAVPLTAVVGIAWKDTREAAGAVSAALPFLRRAGHVTIFTIPEDTEIEDKSPSRLARMLRWHNANVSLQPLPEHTRPPVEVLMDAATQAGCGMLVMGGYGHTRLREAVFGGFTRAVLEAAPLPVLLTH